MKADKFSATFNFKEGKLVIECEKGSEVVHFHWTGVARLQPYYNCGLHPGSFEKDVRQAVNDGRVWGDDVKTEEAIAAIATSACGVYFLSRN
jgi:hypothetical protein